MIITPWGYDVDEASLPDIIDAAAFDYLTAGRWHGDAQRRPLHGCQRNVGGQLDRDR